MVDDKPPPPPSAEEKPTGEVEVQRDISEGMPEMSLRPRTESVTSTKQQQQQQAGSSGAKGRLSVSKPGKSSGKGDKSRSSRRTGRKEKTSRRHKRELIDDNQSEISYQPDTDLSKSRASKKVFTGK